MRPMRRAGGDPLSSDLGIMNIQSLCSEVYDDSEGLLKSMRSTSDGALLLEFECDDWTGTGKRRNFVIRCHNVQEAHVDLGFVGTIAVAAEHPLLLKHQGPQADLYFSTPPASPEIVFALATIALEAEFQGWRDPSELLHGCTEFFLNNLRSGHGLLARGPLPTLCKLRDGLAAHLELQLIHSYNAKGPECRWIAFVMERSWVVCAEVEAHENDA